MRIDLEATILGVGVQCSGDVLLRGHRRAMGRSGLGGAANRSSVPIRSYSEALEMRSWAILATSDVTGGHACCGNRRGWGEARGDMHEELGNAVAAGIRDCKFVANMVAGFRLQRRLNVKQFSLQPTLDKPRLQQHLYRANARQRN